jgi:predicted nucleic-acid-binding Zn-ribbon protein
MYSQRQEDLALFSSHLEVKKAGALVCPICNQTNTIVPKGAPIGEPSGEPVIESEPQFAYAACTNCGYSIFFDTDHLPKRQSS